MPSNLRKLTAYAVGELKSTESFEIVDSGSEHDHFETVQYFL
jgi:hypothetical protein